MSHRKHHRPHIQHKKYLDKVVLRKHGCVPVHVEYILPSETPILEAQEMTENDLYDMAEQIIYSIPGTNIKQIINVSGQPSSCNPQSHEIFNVLEYVDEACEDDDHYKDEDEEPSEDDECSCGCGLPNCGCNLGGPEKPAEEPDEDEEEPIEEEPETEYDEDEV